MIAFVAKGGRRRPHKAWTFPGPWAAAAACILLWGGTAHGGEFRAASAAAGKIVLAGRKIGRRNPASPKPVYGGDLPVCMIKPFGDVNGLLAMGVFMGGEFQTGYSWVFLELAVQARNALLVSGACRLPAADELPTCARRSDGDGRRHIVLGGARVSPSYLIGLEDDELERRLAAYRASMACK